MKLIGIPYDKKGKSYKHFTTLKIQNRLYLKMAKTELPWLCMEPFNYDPLEVVGCGRDTTSGGFLGLQTFSETVLLVAITSALSMKGCSCRSKKWQVHQQNSRDKVQKV